MVLALVNAPDKWSVDCIPMELRGRLAALEGTTIEERISAYEGFGSFHSENVEELVVTGESKYSPPPVPSFAKRILGLSELQKLDTATEEEKIEIWAQLRTKPCEFGAKFRKEHFMLTSDFVFINHGAFGGSLLGALAIKRGYEDLMERQVVDFVDRRLLPLIVHSVRCFSEFLNANPQQIVLVQNATYALNCAMQLIKKDDIVAFIDVEYLSVYKMLYLRCKNIGAELHEIPILRYIHDVSIMGDDAALTREICSNLPYGCTTVVLDYVTSASALCLPLFTHLIPSLKALGVTKIIVDGAHSPLQIDLNFNDLPADAQPSVFVGNLHKWFSLPKSAGFMWVHSTMLDLVHPVVFSHGAGDGFLSEFIWDGTRDYGASLCIPAVIDFWRAQGIDRVREYCSTLLQDATEMLTTCFGTRPVARHAPFMSLVELPESFQTSWTTAKYIQDLLHDIYRIEVPVKAVEGRFYLRISAFVYNTPADYVYLREAVLSISRTWLFSRSREAAASSKLAGAPDKPGSLMISRDPPAKERGSGCCTSAGLFAAPKKKKTIKFS